MKLAYLDLMKEYSKNQWGRQKSLSQKTDNTMANNQKQKTQRTHNTTLKTKAGITRILQNPGLEFRCIGNINIYFHINFKISEASLYRF